MFALKLNNSLLDMSPDTEIQVVLSCPLFDRDKILRTFSYPFQVPLTARNRRALDHIDRFDTNKPWDTDGCGLWVGGAEWEKGELVSIGSGPESMETAFRSLPVTLGDTLSKLNIHELLETIAIPETGDAAEVRLTITAPPFAYDIRIGGIDYTLGIGGSAGMSTSDVGVYFRDLINADYPGMASSTTTHLVLDSAMVNDHNVDWSIMTGFTIDTYVTLGQSAQQSFVNYVTGVIDTPVASHAWPVVEWSGLYQAKNALYEGTVNPVFDGTALLNVEDADESKFQYTFIPMVKVSYVLEKIRAAAGIGYLAGFVDDADFATMLVLNNLTCDKSYKDYYPDEAFKFLNGYVQAIDLNKHVPRMTALDFLKKLADGFNLILEYRDGGLWLTKAVDLVSDTPADWSAYVDARRYDRSITKPEGLTLKWPDNAKEGFSVSGQLADYVVGGGKREKVMPFGTMYMANGFLVDHGTYRCPNTSQAGQSPTFGGNATDLPLALVFYRGIKETSETETYAYATHDELDTDETTVIGGMSLAFEGVYGLVAQNWGGMLGYSDLSELSITVVLPVGEVFRLRKWKNARARFYHPNGAVVMVLRSVEFGAALRSDAGWVECRVKAVVE